MEIADLCWDLNRLGCMFLMGRLVCSGTGIS